MKHPSLLTATFVLASLSVSGQTIDKTPGTVVNPDHSITFRLTYPGAKNVTVATDALLKPLPMTEGSNGIWTATTPPLAPEHYGYTFVVDGVHLLDPLNRDVHPNFVDLYSDILVPGTPPEPWELTDIPHGDVTRHIFTTHIGLHYPANQTAYVVYTPPGYDPARKTGYFAWTGGMSAAMPRSGYDAIFPGLDAPKANLRLLWIACGADDHLIASNRAFVAWAKEKNLPVTAALAKRSSLFEQLSEQTSRPKSEGLE